MTERLQRRSWYPCVTSTGVNHGFDGLKTRPGIVGNSDRNDEYAHLEYVKLALLAEDAAEDPADLADRDVVLYAFNEYGHQVGLGAGGVFEQLEQAFGFRIVPLGADAVEALDLAAHHLLAHAQDFRVLLSVAAELVHADDGAMAVVDGHLVAVGRFLELALLIAHFDGPKRAPDVLDAVEVPRRLFFDVVGQLLDVVGASEGVDDVSHTAFVGDDLLRAKSDLDGLLCRQRERLVHRVGVQGLRPAEDGRKRLDGRADDVVLRLLGGQRGASGLRVEAEHHRPRVLRAKAFLGEASPHATGGAELRDLFDEIREGRVEEGEARSEFVEFEASLERGFHVRDGVGEREGYLLDGGATGLSHVVAADADCVPSRKVVPAPAEYVRNEAHRAFGREDVGAAGDVFLEDVVLGCATYLRQVGALLFGEGDVEGQQDRAGGIDGHRRRDFLERNVLHQELHVRERGDRDADLADLAFGHRVVGVVADLGRQVEGDR